MAHLNIEADGRVLAEGGAEGPHVGGGEELFDGLPAGHQEALSAALHQGTHLRQLCLGPPACSGQIMGTTGYLSAGTHKCLKKKMFFFQTTFFILEKKLVFFFYQCFFFFKQNMFFFQENTSTHRCHALVLGK